MIKVSGLKATQGRLVRETVAPFLSQDADGEHADMIRVRYFTMSIAESEGYRNRIKELGDDALWPDMLLPILESLPDFVDDKDRPAKITYEMLSEMNTVNLQAIHTAIGEDISRPKSRPSVPPNG